MPQIAELTGTKKERRNRRRSTVTEANPAGGKFVDTAAVIAGNVVTGRVPDDLPEFCRAVIDAIAGVAADGVYTLD